ncbi:MAG: circularly permuted type 2 ATP-grasp protein [Bacteriovoracaceae bacterium]|nr:circularly permuted type 2 ATP-grasp protein [Bacteriovoracaceae bacterium]
MKSRLVVIILFVVNLFITTNLTHASVICARGASSIVSGSTSTQRVSYKELVTSPYKLRLKAPDGREVELSSANYLLNNDGSAKAYIKDFVAGLLTRSPQQNQTLFQKMAKEHGLREMTFKVKDKTTGKYDKIFTVSFNGVAPITKQYYDELIGSTAPMMQAMRDLLQRIYSSNAPTAQNLGIAGLPKDVQDLFLRVINETIYLEKKLRDPRMKDYPFLPVAGFDAAVGNLDKMKPVFYEVNDSTPSGLSNQIQLMDVFRQQAPELFSKIEGQIPADKTFKLLKAAIDDNAKAWTGRSDGISVVISPGIFNGAHPDVASIAQFSGMPLVRVQDLYTDVAGNIRLNIGKNKDNPVVTGVYNRMETSFLLQSNKRGVPLISPYYEDNVEVGRRLGVDLRPGVIYRFKYDAQEEIIGVELDAQGRPLLEETFEKMGVDPQRPSSTPGELIDAVLDKKLFVSNVGGRVLDDKRLFQAMAEHIAPKYVKDGRAVAGPPRTLKRDEYEAFYKSDNLKGYVVKAPDMSGGDGIYLMVNLTPQKQQEVVKMVQLNPDRYIIQEFADVSVITRPEVSQSGEVVMGTGALDWRVFPVQFADGTVDAGTNSLLIRTAGEGSASTNTSQGGGYGLGLVLEELPSNKNLGRKSMIPNAKKHSYVGMSRQNEVSEFVEQLNFLTDMTAPGNNVKVLKETVETLVNLNRSVMDLFGRDLSYFMTVSRNFQDGQLTRQEYHQQILDFRSKLQKGDFAVDGLDARVKSTLAKYKSVDYVTFSRIQRENVQAFAKQVNFFDELTQANNEIEILDTTFGYYFDLAKNMVGLVDQKTLDAFESAITGYQSGQLSRQTLRLEVLRLRKALRTQDYSVEGLDQLMSQTLKLKKKHLF